MKSTLYKTISYKIGDCTLIDIDNDKAIVVTCDSIGAIGNKKMDVVKVSPEHVGYTTAKVAIGEMISLGGTPLIVSDGLTVEMEPTGKRIIAGIQKAIEELPEYSIAITGSCEDNMPTVQTGAGITIVGVINKKEIHFKETKETDVAVLLGLPLLGEDYAKMHHLAMHLSHYYNIRSLNIVKEMAPVGSKGIYYEVIQIATENNLSFKWEEGIPYNLYQSGGPSACCIVTLKRENTVMLKNSTDREITVLGEFIRK